MERMILSNDDCVHPVPPLVPDLNNNSLDDSPASDLACHACEFVASHRRELNSHHRVHFVKECSSCSKFIPENAATSHRAKCSEGPPVTHPCGQCDYTSVFIHDVRAHEKRVHGGEHKCNICMKAFDDEEKLSRHHEAAHSGGSVKCQDCDKRSLFLFI